MSEIQQKTQTPRTVKQRSIDVVGSARFVTTARYTKALSQPAVRTGAASPPIAGYDSDGSSSKVCLYKLTYLGALQLDRRVTDKMLKWVLVDIKRRKEVNKRCVLKISNAHIQLLARTDSSDVLLEHNVHSISSFTRCQRDRRCMFYLQRNSIDAPVVMFAFVCEQEDKVVDIFNSIQDSAKTTKKPESILASLKRLNISKLFEVRYQGRIQIAEKSKSGEFIDSWLFSRQNRLLQAEVGKKGSYLELHSPKLRHASDDVRHRSSTTSATADVEGPPTSTPYCDTDSGNGRVRRLSEGSDRDRHDSGNSVKSVGAGSNRSIRSDRSDDNLCTIDSGVFDTDDSITRQSSVASSNSVTSDIFDEIDERDHRRCTLISTHDTNKTMLLQIDDVKTSIISLDKKSIILEKTHKEISYCTQGKKFVDHFGFISYDSQAKKEGRRNLYVMYIFQCASDNVITEVMDTLRSAFTAVHKRNLEMQNCECCPMQQYHKLCDDLTAIKDNESAYNCVQTHIQNLPMSEYSELMNKVKSEHCVSYEEANDVLMTKLRIMCELRQMDHTHGRETDFNFINNRQSKLNVIRNKAKKALAFDMFGKNKSISGSRDDGEWRPRDSNVPQLDLNELNDNDLPSPSASPTSKAAFNISEGLVEMASSGRPRSRTAGDIHKPIPTVTGSIVTPEADKQSILQKLTNMGHSLEEALRGDKFHSPDKNSFSLAARRKASMPAFNADLNSADYLQMNGLPSDSRKKHRRMSSWRRDIFESVVTTPSKTKRNAIVELVKRSMGKEELRGMWRSAIEQTILLNRMEKENTNLREHEEKMKQKRSQLNYEDVTPCKDEVVNRWRSLLGKVRSTDSNVIVPKVDLWNLVKDGVPRAKRGDIWKLLARQYNMSSKGLDNQAEDRPTDMLSYKELLHGLTPHQHAILIDLGRTFPQHEYFKMQLGAGQLALFNILKAYSLVDTDVGYCQGLGFVAGILLMHIEEEESFDLLCHLMYDLGLRKIYKPNMAGLQVSMYQLARLMRDRHSALYQHLEDMDVTPALYAAPWFITLFSSQFSVGFVSRVFDFLFMEGYSAVFKIALSLISVHEDLILASDTFESVTETLKQTLPEMSPENMELVFEKANTLDLANELYTYQIEYHVMEEDILPSSDSASDSSVSKVELANTKLREQNSLLADKVNTQTHKLRNQETMIDALQQSHAKLTKQVRDLELEKSRQVAMIESLREFVPQHLLKQLHITNQSCSQTTASGSSAGGSGARDSNAGGSGASDSNAGGSGASDSNGFFV